MIDCEHVLRFLEAYCDGELPAGDAAAVEQHLDGCVHCLDRRDFRIRLQEVIRRKCRGVEDLPPELVARVQASLPPA